MTASLALAHPLVPLAELNQNKVTPGLLGFVVFAAIALGLWALMKNMGKQMKKIDFEEQPVPRKSPRNARQEPAATAPAAASAASSAAAPERDARA